MRTQKEPRMRTQSPNERMVFSGQLGPGLLALAPGPTTLNENAKRGVNENAKRTANENAKRTVNENAKRTVNENAKRTVNENAKPQ